MEQNENKSRIKKIIIIQGWKNEKKERKKERRCDEDVSINLET